MIEEQYFKAQLAHDTDQAERVKFNRERRQRISEEGLKKAEKDEKVTENKKQIKKWRIYYKNMLINNEWQLGEPVLYPVGLPLTHIRQ